MNWHVCIIASIVALSATAILVHFSKVNKRLKQHHELKCHASDILLAKHQEQIVQRDRNLGRYDFVTRNLRAVLLTQTIPGGLQL